MGQDFAPGLPLPFTGSHGLCTQETQGRNWTCCDHEATRENLWLPLEAVGKLVQPPQSIPGRRRLRQKKDLTRDHAATSELGLGVHGLGSLVEWPAVGYKWKEIADPWLSSSLEGRETQPNFCLGRSLTVGLWASVSYSEKWG